MRSFVIRTGHLTVAQQRALATLLPRYAVPREQPLEAFARQAPRVLEIGIGNGENLVAMAAREPGHDFLGSEVHRPGLGHALLGIEKLELDNLRLHDSDVLDLLAALPPASLVAVHIYFPDPWPKKRHHKRRLMKAGLPDRLARVLRRGGRLYFATDDAHYAAAALALLDETPGWFNLAGHGRFAPRPQHRIVTRFEQRARRAGSAIYDLAFASLGLPVD